MEDAGDFEVDFAHRRRELSEHPAVATRALDEQSAAELPAPPPPQAPRNARSQALAAPPPAPSTAQMHAPARAGERGSPTYEPYQKEAPYDPAASAQPSAQPAAPVHDDAGDEWAWGRGDGRDARAEAHAAWVARKARERALEDKVAALQAQEERERRQRADRRKARALARRRAELLCHAPRLCQPCTRTMTSWQQTARRFTRHAQ